MTLLPIKSLFLTLTAAALVLGTATQSQASTSALNTVVSNLGVAQRPGGNIIGMNSWLATSFTTGNTAASWTLDSVNLRTYFEGDPSAERLSFFVSIHADASGRPGARLASLLGAPLGLTAGNVLHTPNVATQLTANTTYWIATASFDEEFFNSVVLLSANSTAEDVSSPGWSIGNGAALSGDQGASWNPTGAFVAMMAINATPVAIPEPTSVLSVALAGVALLGRRRRLS